MRTPLLALSISALLLTAAGARAQEVAPDLEKLQAQARSAQASSADEEALAGGYLESGRFYEARKIADRLLVGKPGDLELTRIRDAADAGLRQYTETKIREAEQAARAVSTSPEAKLALADAYFEGGRYVAAADTYRQVSAPLMTREVRLRYARALAWSSNTDGAERIYVELLREQDDPDLALEYGRVLSWMGASRAATERLEALYKATGSEDAVVALANARSWNGDREGAIALLQQHLSGNAGAEAARKLLNEISASPQLRLEQVETLIAAEPFNLALRVERARLLIEAGRYSEAIRTLEFVEKNASQKFEGAAELKARAVALRAEELARLKSRRSELDAITPATAAQTLELAKAYVAIEEYDEAIALYERYLSVRGDDQTARVQYARVLGWDKRYNASARVYQDLLKSNPDRADLRLEYAQILSYNNDTIQAMSVFSELTDLSGNPRSHLYSEIPPKAHFNIGQMYRWFGWNDHAVASQNSALELDQSYTAARSELDIVRHLRPAGNIDATYTFAEDSSDFRLTRIDLTGQKWTSRRTAFDVSLGRHRFERGNDEVNANVISGGGWYRFQDRLTARARVGLNFYDEGIGTRPFFGVGAEWLPSLQSRASLDYNHYDLVYDVFTTQSLRQDPISIDDLRGHYDYRTGGHWSWLADVTYGHISDDNNRLGAHGLLTYRIFKVPFVAIKADGRYLQYDFRSPRYYSPDDYKSLAGVLHVGDDFRKRFFWQAELKYGKSWENGKERDVRSYEGRVIVPVNDAFDVVGGYGEGRSGRIDSVFGGEELVTYSQKRWYVGIRLKRLFRDEERRDENNSYYFDERPLGVSPILDPLGERR